LAPGIDDVTAACRPPEVSLPLPLLLPALLVAKFVVRYKPGFLRLPVALIRRTEHAVYEYGQARARLAEFVEGAARADQRPDVYARAHRG
jgi:hypothetical protein